MSDIPANFPDFWRSDKATDDFREKYAEELSQPENMSNGRLCLAVTFCRKIMNPFAVELVRRAGVLDKFMALPDDRYLILCRAARAFGSEYEIII